MSTFPEFPKLDAKLLLPGDKGDIETSVSWPKSNIARKVVVICHPHPLYGGSMDNKVVTTLVRSFNQLDYVAVRFNFRGVGASHGQHDEGRGEADDCSMILRWVQQQLPQAELALAGFSFGSFVAYKVAGWEQWNTTLKSLLLVAPPVSYPEFATLPEPGMSCMVIQGEADEVVNPAAVYQWVEELAVKINLIRMPDTSHFFHGKLIELKQQIIQSLS